MAERANRYRGNRNQEAALPPAAYAVRSAFIEKATAVRTSADSLLKTIDITLGGPAGSKDPSPPDNRPVESRTEILDEQPQRSAVLGAVAVDFAALELFLKESDELLQTRG